MHLRVRSLAALAAIAVALPGAAMAQQLAGIETQQLRQLDAWSVGAISATQGGLPASLWTGTDPAFLAAALDRLPAVYESPAAQALARRVLLSGGDAPSGDAQPAARKRFEALGKMGAADELAIMASGSGPSLSDPAIAQYAAQAELARGRRAEACARGRQAQADAPPPFILRLRAYCAAVTGDRAAANLALDSIRGGGTDDVWYAGAVSAAAGAPGARPPMARYDNSLTAQLSLAAQLRPGPNPLGNASNLSLLALATSDAAPQPVRAQAAALAYRRGLISTANARAILHATPPEIASGLPAIALALRQVEAAPGSLDAATAISGVLRAATTPADFYAASRFFHDDIIALNSAPDTAATIAFARAAIVVGDADNATRLVASARAANVEPDALAPLDAALQVLLSGQGRGDAGAPKRRIDAAGASFRRVAARDVAIMGAIGFPLDNDVAAFLLANPPLTGAHADPALMLSLRGGVERRAVGEVGVLAVLIAGNGPSRLDTQSLCDLIGALKAAGLEADARRFAVEAILAGAPAS